MLMRHSVLVLVGWLTVSNLAHAGPIQFGYATTAALSPGSPSPSSVKLEFLSGGTPYFSEYGGSFTIGWVRLNHPNEATRSDVPDDFSDFHITVAIDDQEGHTGVLTLNGSDGKWEDGSPENNAHRLDFGEPDDVIRITTTNRLGDNLYSLTASLKDEGTVAEILLGVRPDPITTPEPGTLALAAISLLPLGARSIRRRMLRSS